jgi:hypothetical protein
MAQFKDEGLPDDEASRLLRAEYEVLCQCNGFKSKFDAFACESLVAVPGVSLLTIFHVPCLKPCHQSSISTSKARF